MTSHEASTEGSCGMKHTIYHGCGHFCVAIVRWDLGPTQIVEEWVYCPETERKAG